MTDCPQCGASTLPGDQFCPSCGYLLPWEAVAGGALTQRTETGDESQPSDPSPPASVTYSYRGSFVEKEPEKIVVTYEQLRQIIEEEMKGKGKADVVPLPSSQLAPAENQEATRPVPQPKATKPPRFWPRLVFAFGVTLFAVYFGFGYLERSIVANPGDAFYYVLVEWLLIALPGGVGGALLIEEVFTKDKRRTLYDVDEFIDQVNDGSLKLGDEGFNKLTRLVDAKFKVSGQSLSVKAVASDDKKTGVVVERGLD